MHEQIALKSASWLVFFDDKKYWPQTRSKMKIQYELEQRHMSSYSRSWSLPTYGLCKSINFQFVCSKLYRSASKCCVSHNVNDGSSDSPAKASPHHLISLSFVFQVLCLSEGSWSLTRLWLMQVDKFPIYSQIYRCAPKLLCPSCRWSFRGDSQAKASPHHRICLNFVAQVLYWFLS